MLRAIFSVDRGFSLSFTRIHRWNKPSLSYTRSWYSLAGWRDVGNTAKRWCGRRAIQVAMRYYPWGEGVSTLGCFFHFVHLQQHQFGKKAYAKNTRKCQFVEMKQLCFFGCSRFLVKTLTKSLGFWRMKKFVGLLLSITSENCSTEDAARANNIMSFQLC